MKSVSPYRKLRTTTWHKRNSQQISLAARIAYDLQIEEPDVIDIWPGWMIPLFNQFIPSGERDEWSRVQSFLCKNMQMLESLMRKTDLFPLQCFEFLELVWALEKLRPKSFTVIDVEKKVLQGVLESVKKSKLAISMEQLHLVQKDITRSSLAIKWNILFCINMIQRTPSPENTLLKVAELVQDEGLLVLQKKCARSVSEILTDQWFNEIEKGIFKNGSL